MSPSLTDPIFTDEDKAREHFEAIHWPNGPACPHCGATSEHVTLMVGKLHRAGLYQCNACREPFTVKMGTVMESSHISYRKSVFGRKWDQNSRGVKCWQTQHAGKIPHSL